MFKRLKKHIIWICLFFGAFLLISNAINYDYRGGYDSWAHIEYSKVISSKWRFPTKLESHETYNPPLFYLLSGIVVRFASFLTGKDFYNSLNTFKIAGVLLAVGYICLWTLIFKHLYPKKKKLQMAFTVLLFSLPVFHKTIVMFNTEILLMFLAALALWYFVVVFQKNPTIFKTVVLAAITSLALLTRFPALPLFLTLILGIIGLKIIGKISLKKTTQLLSVFLIFIIASTSWFYYGRRNQGIYTGARTTEPKEIPFFKRQPLAFYTEIPFTLIMNYPIRFDRNTPLNRLIPIYYSDFWGDWWNYFSQRRFGVSVEARRQDHYLTSPERVANLSLQNRVNLPFTLIILSGFIYLTVKNLKKLFKKPDKKWLIETMFLSLTFLTWIGLLTFLTKYPYYKANGVKPSYMLSTIPVYIYVAVIFINKVIKSRHCLFIPLIIWLSFSTLVNLWFDYY